LNRSLLTRIGGFVAAAALSTTALSAVAAAPAHADNATCSTRTTLEINGEPRSATAVWGSWGLVSAETTVVSCSGGSNHPSFVAHGNIVIQRSIDGGRTWTTVLTDTASYASKSGDNLFSRNALYRATYQGATEPYSNPDRFLASQSATLRVNVIRDIDWSYKSRRGGITSRWKLSPRTGLVGKRLPVKVLKNRRWVAYKRVAVNRYGVASTFLDAGRREQKYRLIIPANSGLSGSWHGVRVY
jgi:hypothetical protein